MSASPTPAASRPSDAVPAAAVPAASHVLEINNLEVVYNRAVQVLHGLSLKVPRGQIVALLGSNGAGKTTTLKAVSNLLAAERGQILAGSIRYDGIDVSATKPSDLVRRGLVPVLEGRHVFRSLTVEESVRARRSFGGTAPERVREAVEAARAALP